ncbi:MAG: PRD domain-containing protein [Lachnospiraceae bacterium]|nr:PRD domain-containing protein [Lachnospiraceae bacterium]
MELTPRIKQIIAYLLNTEQPATDNEVAAALGVSKRTILRETDYITSALKAYDLELVRKKGEGSRITGSTDRKKELLEAISSGNDYDSSDKTKRRNFLKLELLRNREPQKLYYFSALLGVSEATISTDMEAINAWAEECHLKLVRKPGFGVVLTGSEKNYRIALQRFVTESIGNAGQADLGDNIYRLMNEAILSEVGNVLEDMDEPYLKMLTNDAYIGLMVHIAVAVERIRQGRFVAEEDTYDARYEKGYEIARAIADALSKAFDLEIPEAEVNNILLHIKGAKLNYSNRIINESGIEAEKLLGIVDAMIDATGSPYADEMKYEDDFIRGLLVHLEPALYRMKNGMTISNPLLSEIKAEYPDIYEQCTRAASVIEERTGLIPGEAEIGYLTMHFGAATERIESRKKKKRQVNIGVICASGFGVAQLMMAKLKNHFGGSDISLKAYGSDEITEHVVSRTDFFVSSINVENLGVDCCLISPLITQRDLLQIGVKIDEYANMPIKQENNDFARQLDEINEIITAVKGVIRRYHHLYVSDDVELNDLVRILAEDITSSKQGAAVLAADIISRENVMSQLFPEIGIALFHCRSRAVRECHIISAGTPGAAGFKDEKLKKIRAVLCMTMPYDENRKRNSEMLGRVSGSLIDDESFLKSIQSGSERLIRDKLQDILKDYFNELLYEV